MDTPRIHAACLALCLAPLAAAQEWAGKWFTTEGVLVLEAKGTEVTGRYGTQQKGSLAGEASGPRLTFTYRNGDADGEGTFELDASGHRFDGEWRRGDDRGTWRGWQQDPAAVEGAPADFSGAWQTSWGLMQLVQKGDSVEGGFGAQGWSTVRGEVRGRRLLLDYSTPSDVGAFWVELQPQENAGFGGARSAGGRGEWPWIARRLEGHTPAVQPKPGAIVGGLGENRLTYFLRAPKRYRPGKPVPAIVIFHGSNMSSRPYVESIATLGNLGERFMLIGIDGERWQDSSAPDDPRHNYTYVNWMGKSTYEGYPNTHRESPALVAELIEELKKRHRLSKILVGGHSQGGFLSYFLLMHFPDLVDGVFPISCGLVIQCEPDVFDDPALQAAQRATPLAIVHGKNDPTVSFSMGEAARRSFAEHGFPAVRMFDNDAGHGFAFLRVQEAIDWLDAMSSDEAKALLELAQSRLDEDGFRDVMAVVVKLRGMKPGAAHSARAERLAAAVDEYAAFAAERYLREITANEDASWIDGFLEFRDQFEFADVAQPAMAAFAKLRAEHEGPARELYAQARRAFRDGDRDSGRRKYRKLVESYYASSLYRRVKGWLED